MVQYYNLFGAKVGSHYVSFPLPAPGHVFAFDRTGTKTPRLLIEAANADLSSYSSLWASWVRSSVVSASRPVAAASRFPRPLL